MARKSGLTRNCLHILWADKSFWLLVICPQKNWLNGYLDLKKLVIWLFLKAVVMVILNGPNTTVSGNLFKQLGELEYENSLDSIGFTPASTLRS